MTNREEQWWHEEHRRRENNGRHDVQCRCGECERRREEQQAQARRAIGEE